MPNDAPKNSEVVVVSAAAVQARILVIRDRQVMLDQELAELYGVETGALTRAVRRNEERFPSDFMFQLTKDEHADLKRQIGISRNAQLPVTRNSRQPAKAVPAGGAAPAGECGHEAQPA